MSEKFSSGTKKNQQTNQQTNQPSKGANHYVPLFPRQVKLTWTFGSGQIKHFVQNIISECNIKKKTILKNIQDQEM